MNETKELILTVAEELFSKRGYAAVKLRDIANEVGMRHASLYYYAPGGKEELFVEVMKRSFERHREGIAHAIDHADDGIFDQLNAVAEWMISQPPMDLARMVEADFPAIDSTKAGELEKLAIDSVTRPIIEALESAEKRGAIAPLANHSVAAMALTTLMQSINHIPDHAMGPDPDARRKEIGQTLVNMLLYGWLPRQERVLSQPV